MLIQKTSIRNVTACLEAIAPDTEIRITTRLDEVKLRRLSRIGFGEPPENGETVLPLGIGPVSRFNADGRWVIHRDRPKEERYIRTVRWQWKQWHGRDHEEMEDFKDIYRLCYPRTFIPPPAVELTYVQQGEHSFVFSPVLVNQVEQHELIRHTINLMLELFGECELTQRNLTPFDDIKTHRVLWKMLPQGAHPWPRLHAHLTAVLRSYSDNTKAVIYDRQKTILEHAPDEQFIGTGGFSDYIAYVFKARGVVVLECIRKGNAIYVFGQHWVDFTKLSKAEVISAGVHTARIVHTEGWKERLARILNATE